jgi:phage replication initiation protein
MIKEFSETASQKPENKVLYDWVGFSSKIHTKNEIIRLLGLENILSDAWADLPGFYGYTQHVNFDGINIMWGGRNEGVFVELSGKGCRAFETFGNGDYEGIFRLIKSNYNHSAELRTMNLTRLDVAYDDVLGILDIDNIAMNSLREPFGRGQNYVTRFKSDGWRDPVQVIMNVGKTIEYGSMKSNVFFRMYDKRVERHADDVPHWIRFEIQLRDIKAMAFIDDPGDIREKYFKVVNEYIEYKKPHKTDSNKSRWNTAKYWLEFIENGGKLAVFRKPGTEYNRDRLQKYVYEQAGGAVAAEAELIGAEKFVEHLQKTRAEMLKKENPKYSQLVYNEKQSALTQLVRVLTNTLRLKQIIEPEDFEAYTEVQKIKKEEEKQLVIKENTEYIELQHSITQDEIYFQKMYKSAKNKGLTISFNEFMEKIRRSNIEYTQHRLSFEFRQAQKRGYWKSFDEWKTETFETRFKERYPEAYEDLRDKSADEERLFNEAFPNGVPE